MAWVIQRRAPQEPLAYWGKREVWVLRAPSKPATPPRIPESAAVYHDWDVAFQVAEWLRLNQPIAYGEVIALTNAPDGSA